MTKSPPHLSWSAKAFAIASIAFSLIAIWMVVHAAIVGRESEDDLHYLYYSATKGVDSLKFQETGARIQEFLQNEAKDPFYSYRFNERQKIVDNYPFLSVVIREVRAIKLPEVINGDLSYPEALVSIFNISLHVTTTLTLLCFAACLALVRKSWLPWVSSGLVLILAMDWYFPWQPPIWILHVRPQTIAEVFERLVQTLALAFTAGGMASDFPRGHFLMLALPVFLLRWSLRYRSSYALAAITAMVHFGMGLLLMLCLVFTDLLVRRNLLRTPAVLALITGSFCLFATLMTLQLGFLPAWTPFATGAIVATLLWVLSGIRRPAALDALIERIAKNGPVFSDLLILYGIWLVLLPISVVMYFSTIPKPIWTWGELPGRYLLMMRGPLVIGGIILIIEKFPQMAEKWVKTVAVVSLTGSLVLVAHSINLPNTLAVTPLALPEQFAARERTALSAEAGNNHEYVEADVYFAVVRSLDLGKPFPNALLTYSPDACRRRYESCER